MAKDHLAIIKDKPNINAVDDSFDGYGLDKDGNKVFYTEDEVKAARVLLDQEAADKVAADKVVADKKAADQKSGNDKFLALGLTQDEATALTGYAP